MEDNSPKTGRTAALVFGGIAALSIVLLALIVIKRSDEIAHPLRHLPRVPLSRLSGLVERLIRSGRDRERQTGPAPAPPAPEPAAPEPAPHGAHMIGSPADWFSEETYPPYAKRHSIEGRVSVRLTIDETGLVSDCRVTASSGVPTLDQATCADAISNGRFKPAVDASGKPITSELDLPPVRWQLKDE
ncbi:energy transducer TonB [Sphingomonas sp. GlSt437]|uniref:energy transducer TonB n=1 Tax=Sphingomonas sp. GlSt437 TaxID=3389970 RepID=UPI003A84E791